MLTLAAIALIRVAFLADVVVAYSALPLPFLLCALNIQSFYFIDFTFTGPKKVLISCLKS